jgi:signal transduction histidine kinase
VLLFSNFVTRDMRRLALMRSIESQSKQQLIGELQALVAQKDAFMSSVSHELRTPLNGIIGAWLRKETLGSLLQSSDN